MITAREALDQAKALLLDFDGPMARLMPPPVNAQVAERVRNASGVALPPALMESTDHLAVLKALLDYPYALCIAEAEATRAEVECAQVCEVAPWLTSLATLSEHRALPLAVVSNNSTQAVQTFLDRADVPLSIRILVCRTPQNVSNLKPSPHLLRHALHQLHTPAHESVFIGDSVSDIEAGQAANMQTIGYAKNANRFSLLEQAGAIAMITVEVNDIGLD